MKCENSNIIKAWFLNVLKRQLRNMDETSFQMGVTSTAKVVCGFKIKSRHSKALQPGNREWVIPIVAINALG